jgi:mRNA-degrading endonuclease RelE of RelBE toxin-antitoxin system
MATQSVEIPDHVLTALKRLTPKQRQQVFDLVEGLSQEQNLDEQLPGMPKKKRGFGQYAGRISMGEDFDDPLPDSFWLGE